MLQHDWDCFISFFSVITCDRAGFDIGNGILVGLPATEPILYGATFTVECSEGSTLSGTVSERAQRNVTCGANGQLDLGTRYCNGKDLLYMEINK